jgi:hypothetical protein
LVIHGPTFAVIRAVKSIQEVAMTRRLLGVLAVPALALGFAFAPAGTDEAQAYPGPYDLQGVACSIAAGRIAYAASQGDEASAGELYSTAVAGGCDPWLLIY